MRARAPLALLALAIASAARAEPAPLRYDLRVDGAITAGAAVLLLSTELAKRSLAPSSCRWCEENRLDAGARNRLVWSDNLRAKYASDVAVAVLPAALAAHQLLAARAEGDAKEGWVDVLIVGEAAMLAMDLNQLLKFAVGRQRPFVRGGNYPEPGRAPDPDDNLSFYSAHTALAFACAAAAGTVSDLRGYRSAPWVWGAGVAFAAGVGYLRIAADKHYLSDVLTGALVGTAAGIAVPRLLHGRKDATGSPPTPAAPATIGFRMAF